MEAAPGCAVSQSPPSMSSRPPPPDQGCCGCWELPVGLGGFPQVAHSCSPLLLLICPALAPFSRDGPSCHVAKGAFGTVTSPRPAPPPHPSAAPPPLLLPNLSRLACLHGESGETEPKRFSREPHQSLTWPVPGAASCCPKNVNPLRWAHSPAPSFPGPPTHWNPLSRARKTLLPSDQG